MKSSNSFTSLKTLDSNDFRQMTSPHQEKDWWGWVYLSGACLELPVFYIWPHFYPGLTPTWLWSGNFRVKIFVRVCAINRSH
jgi:hypothetical protein